MKDIKNLLGQRIKDLRIKRGYSQQQLSELINIDQRNLSNIECGNTFPAKSLLAIAEALQVSLPELFDFNYLAKNSEEMKKQIIKNLDNLNDENIKIIYRLVQTMN